MSAGYDNPSSEDREFYWFDDIRVARDGTISMPVSGFADDGATHWSGRFEVTPGEVDYLLWAWIISDPTRANGLKSSSDIESLRRVFATS